MVRAPWMLCWSASGAPVWFNTQSHETAPCVKEGPHPPATEAAANHTQASDEPGTAQRFAGGDSLPLTILVCC